MIFYLVWRHFIAAISDHPIKMDCARFRAMPFSRIIVSYQIQLVLCVLMTSFSLLFALVAAIESPPYLAENTALISVGLLNALWAVPYAILFRSKGDRKAYARVVKTFLVVFLPVLCFNLYQTPFYAPRWKYELDYTRIYDKYPAHVNGNMMEDIINSKIAVGITLQEIQDLFGSNYFINSFDGDTTLYFFYSNPSPFDGCDKLYIHMRHGRSTDAGYGGCD